MAHSTPISQPDPLERVLTAIADLLELAAAKHAHHRVFRTSLEELRSLSAADLADLGLNPSMLRSCAKEAADKHVAL
ncbi:MAG: DUF1127 domain-containing protein [Roseobacter sp.]